MFSSKYPFSGLDSLVFSSFNEREASLPPPLPPTMGHFRKSSYAYLLFKNGTILITITSTTSIHKGKATTATINAKKNIYIIFACYVQRVRYLRF